jgi:hypothetical protein
MAMSATSAAKRRRAGGVLTSPMLQPPHVIQSIPTTRLISTLQNMQQVTPDQLNNQQHQQQQHVSEIQQGNNIAEAKSYENKGLTLQQVITLLDKRLIQLEQAPPSNVSEVNVSNLSNSIVGANANIKLDEIVDSRLKSVNVNVEDIVKNSVNEIIKKNEEHIAQHFNEFNERCELLATEILNIKNMVLDLQNYTMNVNKTLFEERINLFSDVQQNQIKTTTRDVELETDVLDLIEEPATEAFEPVLGNREQETENEAQPEKEEVDDEAENISETTEGDSPTAEVNSFDNAPVDIITNVNASLFENLNQSEDSEFVMVSAKTKQKKQTGKNQKKKNSVNVEEEISLAI